MKYKRVVPSAAPVTTIVVNGQPRHYFHSDKLGKCRAVIIAEDENLPPAPKAEKSHRQSIDEIIDEYEQELAKKAEISNLYKTLGDLLGHLKSLPFWAEAEFESTLYEIKVIRDEIYRLEQS